MNNSLFSSYCSNLCSLWAKCRKSSIIHAISLFHKINSCLPSFTQSACDEMYPVVQVLSLSKLLLTPVLENVFLVFN